MPCEMVWTYLDSVHSKEPMMIFYVCHFAFDWRHLVKVRLVQSFSYLVRGRVCELYLCEGKLLMPDLVVQVYV